MDSFSIKCKKDLWHKPGFYVWRIGTAGNRFPVIIITINFALRINDTEYIKSRTTGGDSYAWCCIVCSACQIPSFHRLMEQCDPVLFVNL